MDKEDRKSREAAPESEYAVTRLSRRREFMNVDVG